MGGINDREDVIQAWAESAQYWEKHHTIITAMFAPVTDALVGAARIRPGQRVLDVAGGAGEPSLPIAGIVGSGGHVDYCDPVKGMMDIAQRQARDRGLTNISFHCAPAESLPFADHSFDAITCRFGAMFFADPDLGIKEMLRVLKPGGAMALAVWRERRLNPFFAVVADVVDRYIEPVPEDPDAPGAFRFATSGSLSRLLVDAGAANVSESVLEFPVQAPLALDQFWTVRVELSETLRSKVARLRPVQLESARQEVTRAAAVYYESGAPKIPAQAYIVRASRES
jgi:ubiquinone/menaquinone biosynthesis C-methylase UbiE